MFSKKYKIITSLILILGVFFTSVVIGYEKENVDSSKMEAKGFQWEVKKGDKTMYLVGTMHPINKDYEYFTKTIKDIVKNTDVLAVEINPSENELLKSNADGIYSGGNSIEDELNEKQIKNLKSICKEVNCDYEKIKILKPHLIINNLQSVLYDKAGLTMETFDDMLIKNSLKKNKKIVELETITFQMNLLDKINGINALKGSLDLHKEGKFIENGKAIIEYSKELMKGYSNGDTKVMEEAVKFQKQNKEEYNLMIKDRNKNMVKKMEGFFNENGVYTIAVGALHFFGDDGIVNMMKDKGYEVTKIE
ncbi:TraB/GumN family protein [Eubacterium multiforme]|uniref:TraB/GumN family protein n=1 Tax=Eubacterium multiforme TaxID=83339 RepID=UPI0027D90F68|nr:TraB/GumN family protein [Eubacterium multiforme]